VGLGGPSKNIIPKRVNRYEIAWCCFASRDNGVRSSFSVSVDKNFGRVGLFVS
jgi:hypothetical protein